MSENESRLNLTSNSTNFTTWLYGQRKRNFCKLNFVILFRPNGLANVCIKLKRIGYEYRFNFEHVPRKFIGLKLQVYCHREFVRRLCPIKCQIKMNLWHLCR